MTVIAGAWAFVAASDVQQGGDLLRSPLASAATLIGAGVGPPAFLLFLLEPAMVLTIELVHRFGASSRAARSLLGAASWAAWCLFVAITLAATSHVVLVPGVLADSILPLAVAGAGYALLAFDGHDVRPGRALTLLALGVTASVILGSVWIAGRWGGPA